MSSWPLIWTGNFMLWYHIHGVSINSILPRHYPKSPRMSQHIKLQVSELCKSSVSFELFAPHPTRCALKQYRFFNITFTEPVTWFCALNGLKYQVRKHSFHHNTLLQCIMLVLHKGDFLQALVQYWRICQTRESSGLESFYIYQFCTQLLSLKAKLQGIHS